MAEPSTDQPQTTSVEPTEQRHGGAGTSLLWLFVLPIVYILSLGPVCKLDQTFDGTHKTPTLERGLQIFYLPIEKLAEHSRPFTRFMSWYCRTVWHAK
jgi:hypothetical protein